MRERCGFHNYISWRTFRDKGVIERIGTRGWGAEGGTKTGKKTKKGKGQSLGNVALKKRKESST